MDSFYITLPSNDPSYENNKASHFTVRLPETMELDNSWTVSMSSIIYPISFSTLGAEEEQYVIITYLDKNDTQQKEKIKFASLNFHTIKEMENSINAIIRQNLIQKAIKTGKTYLGESRLRRSTDSQLTPIEESNEIKEKIRQLQQKKQQQQTQEKPKSEASDKSLTPVTENVEIQRKKDQLQLESAKRAAENAVRDIEQKNNQINSSINTTINKLNTLLNDIKNVHLNQEINEKISKIRENIVKLQAIADKINKNYQDAKNAKNENNTAYNQKNVQKARKEADNSKKVLANVITQMEEASRIQNENENLFNNSNLILNSLLPKTSAAADPVVLDQNMEDKKLIKIEEDAKIKEKVEEIKRTKQKEGFSDHLTPIQETEEIVTEETLEKRPEPLLTFDEEIPQLIKSVEVKPKQPQALGQKPFNILIDDEKFKVIRDKFTKDPYTKVYFFYDETIQKFIAFFQDTILHIELSPDLAYALGYSNQLFVMKGYYAQFMPTLTGGIRQLYVYSPIVEQSILGYQKAPLLRVVNVIGEPGQVQEAIYSTEYHYRLQTKRISEITIEIRSTTGKLVKFEWGNTIVTLHFKRSLFI